MSKLLEVPADQALSQAQKETLGGIPPSLQSLFDRDPLSLTRPELNAVVEELRAQRKNFVGAETEAKNLGRRVNAKKAIKGETKGNASLAALLEDL